MPSLNTRRRLHARKPLGRRAAPGIPATMRAVAIDAFGDPGVLLLHTLPVPQPGANEVLIAVEAAAVGTWDPRIRAGEWAEDDTNFPLILGTDGSGTVAAVGARVTRLGVGDRVYGYSFENSKGGWYAEYVATAAGNVARVPKGLDAITAGAVPAIGLTALQGVDDALEIAAGENVIVHGASGNVGMLAVQFAKRRGARVLGVASGRDGVELVRRLGADEAIDGKSDDIEGAAKRFAPNGVDAVLAFAGGKELTRILDTVKSGGRLAYPNGVEPEPRKRRGLKIKSYDAESGVRQFERLNTAIEESKLQVPIAAVFPLEQAARAHERLESGHLLGKIVLDVGRTR
jgi:NADPH:quinone reductase-like Zn-dependent oxidoreductase